MTMSTKTYQRESFHTVNFYLIYDDADAAIKLYKTLFGAEEHFRLPAWKGDGVGHAEIRIGDTILMMADECPEMEARPPKLYGGSPVSMIIYVEDPDEVYAQALKAGCKALRTVDDMFYGDRAGTLEDPFGYRWTIAKFVEEVSPEEMTRRMQTMCEPEG